MTPPPEDDSLEPRTIPIRRRRREKPDDADPPATIDVEERFPGAVFMVPDSEWEIEAEDRIEHPGLCLAVDLLHYETTFLQGRGAEGLRWFGGYYLIAPTQGNGLDKSTAFRLRPTVPIRLHRARRLYPSKHRGWITPDELAHVRATLERIIPSE